MRSQEEVQEALRQTARDLEHLEEIRAMRNLNQGFSEIRNRALNEVERLMMEKREVLMWILGGPTEQA